MPQGSVIAPLLYACFINDLAPVVRDATPRCEFCLFADDLNVWPKESGRAGAVALARCLQRVSSWADTWRVRFGAKKCNVVLFGRKAVSAEVEKVLDNLRLTDFKVTRVPSYTFLGVVLDERLD